MIWAPNWVDFFAIGMATATYSAAHHAGLRLPSLLRFLGDHPGGVVVDRRLRSG